MVLLQICWPDLYKMPTIPRIKKADAKETLLDIGLSKAAFPIKATED